MSAETADLLDAIISYVRIYVVLSEQQAQAIALWVLHTHTAHAVEATPYLNITSAAKRCGKSRLLEVLELVVASPWLTSRTTAAVLARKIDAEHPTLLLDESDAAFKGDKEYAHTLRGILNSGHRPSGTASVCVGQGSNISYRDLSTYCPKAIAGIGDLPDTVVDRCIVIRLERRANAERIERFRHREASEYAADICDACVDWASEHAEELADARPALPDALDDRAQDGWEPLLAIAELASDEWARHAQRVAVQLAQVERPDTDSARLLTLMRDVFATLGGRISTVEAIERLADDDSGPWSDWWDEHQGVAKHAARGLAGLLGPYGIKSRAVRPSSGTPGTPRGYAVEDFETAFSRYLPPRASATSATSLPLSQADVADVADVALPTDTNGAALGAEQLELGESADPHP